MRRKILCILMVMIVGVTACWSISAAGDNESKLDELNSQIRTLQKQLKEGQAKENELASRLKGINDLIGGIENEIGDLESDIEVASNKTAIAQTKLDTMEAEMEKQNMIMGQRIRAMYKNGETSYLEILLSSENIGDFMTNLDMSKRIISGDQKILEEMEEQYLVLEQQRNELKVLQKNLEGKRSTLASRKGDLKSSQADVAALKAEVSGENDEIEAVLDAVNAEANAIKAEILSLQNPDASYTGGGMVWPCPASHRITSSFGYRLHPILKVNKLHTGIDIGASAGSNILAANAGTVIKAGWNNSYGYMVMVDHGGGIVTLYAHSSSLLVSAGATVSKGQVIALVGSTGMSTGPHLHFEVRVNGEYVNPLSYVSN